MSFNISASLLVVSSKPGVSTNVTILPSIVNGSVQETVSVQDLRESLVLRVEPDIVLMNFENKFE